jgi:hypothetical protein
VNEVLPDIRLDFISEIEQSHIDMMTKIRKQFILLDNELRTISTLKGADREGASRCLSIARTKIETACQYTIKSLCVMGEVK